ncbi:antitoxin [Ectothiorhodospira variabilis]|uniref:antitoxin n=1 Tax=Ectothiorhodospira variabilis TaxID=505694 RepID=UPI001EFB5BC2|nr:antitoxin [Ectothiorhodospira variabilis]MCG5494670.1 antitoxin [Ectothiorhodospira variabilis]MCG5499074.1 antitoxin [Ectothiorhodospira variabilis]MCG5505108.1 antitoxin [Ectothiorhodospira variabilis]MCG5508265.1 antitoxin [Ectothiorhodospira variabilis]
MSELGDEEEKQILEAFDSGTLKRAAHAANTQNRHRAYAEAISKKDARINIRPPFKDLRAQKKVLAEKRLKEVKDADS